MEWKTWVEKRMTPDSVFTGEIVVTVARLNLEGEYWMIDPKHF
jgi:hypothetical protein